MKPSSAKQELVEDLIPGEVTISGCIILAVSWLSSRIHPDHRRKPESGVGHDGQLSLGRNETSGQIIPEIFVHLLLGLHLGREESVVFKVEPPVLVKDEADPGRVEPVRMFKGRGCVKFVPGAFDDDAAVFKRDGEAADVQAGGSEDFPVVDLLVDDLVLIRF